MQSILTLSGELVVVVVELMGCDRKQWYGPQILLIKKDTYALMMYMTIDFWWFVLNAQINCELGYQGWSLQFRILARSYGGFACITQWTWDLNCFIVPSLDHSVCGSCSRNMSGYQKSFLLLLHCVHRSVLGIVNMSYCFHDPFRGSIKAEIWRGCRWRSALNAVHFAHCRCEATSSHVTEMPIHRPHDLWPPMEWTWLEAAPQPQKLCS